MNHPVSHETMKALFPTLTLLAVTSIVTAADFYVAPNGNDAWSGKLQQPNAGRTDGPLATLQRARDEVRRMRRLGTLPERGCTVEGRV